jgi:hypothetical protein
MRFSVALVSVLLGGGVLAGSTDPLPTFVKKPAVTKTGDKMELSFVLSTPTDVEVAVLNSTGKVVRHLAAGLLGAKNPPPEPLKPGLVQGLVWDGLDDFGKPVDAKGGRFRVRAGMKPELDGFLLENPASSGPVSAVAVGPKGEVYLFHRDATANNNMGDDKIKVINRSGKYLRTIKPFSAGLPLAKVKAFGAVLDQDGAVTPIIQNWEQLNIYPDPIKARGRSMSPWASPVVDSSGRVYWPVMGPSIACLEADGGVPKAGFMGPRLLTNIQDLATTYLQTIDFSCLAISGDEKYLYLAGLIKGKRVTDATPLPCVFRVGIEKRDSAEVFVGKLDVPGREKEALTAPCGLAVAKGLLYVCDRPADRVEVFREDNRSLVGEIKIKAPQSVGVDPETGAIYVVSVTDKNSADLVKFDSLVSGKEISRLPLGKNAAGSGSYRLAVDVSARPPLLWMPGRYNQRAALCVADVGGKLEFRDDPRDLKTPWAEGPRDMTIDRTRQELYVKINDQKWYRIDEPTGKINDIFASSRLGMGNAGTQIVPAPDGSLVTLSWGSGISRLDHKGKDLNWPGYTTNRIPYGGIMNFMQRFLAVPKADELYVILPNKYRIKDEAERKKITSDVHSVDVIGPDGALKRTAIWQCSRGAGLRVDHKGNIYLAELVKPAGRSFPEFFDGKITPMTKSSSYTSLPAATYWNSYMYGSIIKFPPSGGAVWFDKDKKLSPSLTGAPPADLLAKPVMKAQSHLVWNPAVPVEIQGAEWMRFGYSGCSMNSGSDLCMCESSGFDIDYYGRVFYPNLGQFRIEMVDANNNFIGTFGKYGNQDSGGPNATVKTPDIPLAWPLTVAVSDTHVYVADTVSRRVVKVKLGYRLSEECEMK